MAKKEKEYHRLPGKGLRRQGSWVAATRTISTLWMSRDHLLCIDSMGGYSEDYKRFYYRDIQAIVLRETDFWRNWNLFWGVASALVVFVSLMTLHGIALGLWLGLAAFLFALLLINLLRGRTCVCHIRTAVQTEELPSLRRLRTARKAIARLKPLIEEAQGTITPEELPARMQELVTRQAGSNAATPVKTPRRSSASASRVASNYNGSIHLMLFGLLLLDVAHTGLDFFVRGVGMTALSVLLWAGIAFSLVMSLIKQHKDLPAGLRRVTWGILVYTLVVFAIGYVETIVISIKNAESKRVITQWDIVKIHAETSPFDSTWMMAMMIFSLICSLALGVVGMLRLRQFRQKTADQSSLESGRGEVPARQNEN